MQTFRLTVQRQSDHVARSNDLNWSLFVIWNQSSLQIVFDAGTILFLRELASPLPTKQFIRDVYEYTMKLDRLRVMSLLLMIYVLDSRRP